MTKIDTLLYSHEDIRQVEEDHPVFLEQLRDFCAEKQMQSAFIGPVFRGLGRVNPETRMRRVRYEVWVTPYLVAGAEGMAFAMEREEDA